MLLKNIHTILHHLKENAQNAISHVMEDAGERGHTIAKNSAK
jgi:hypothetical protein